MFTLMILDIGTCYREHKVVVDTQNVPQRFRGKTRIYLRDGQRISARPMGEFVTADSGWPTLKQAQKVAA